MPDNYDILEPTAAPSGTTTRTVRALDVGSGELAGAAVLVDSNGTVVPKAEDSAHTTADPGIPILGVVRTTPLGTSSTAGDYAMPTIDDRGRLYTRTSGNFHVRLTSAAPTPTGSDITDDSGAAITSDMLAIRNTGPAVKYFFIPFGVAGYTQMVITIGHGTIGGVAQGATPFNQAVNGGLFTSSGVGLQLEFQQLIGTVTFTASSNQVLVLGSFNGATIPYALNPAAITLTTANLSRYNIPEMALPAPYIYWFFSRGGTAPTSGSVIMDISRW
jgi:hypothetical protein